MYRCLIFFGLLPTLAYGQSFVFPSAENWNELTEGQPFTFTVGVSESDKPKFSLDDSNTYGATLDSLGHFSWTPPFTLVDRLEQHKEVSFLFVANWRNGHRLRKSVSFIIKHQNRPPVVEDLPTFYVKQSTENQYQISNDYATDPDDDPISFKPIISMLPEGMHFSSQGLVTWKPSRNQFNGLKNNPMTIEFLAQDQPEKTETRARLKIAQTQLDLPPELLLVPSDSVYSVKEDERLNIKVYASDPNGDENLVELGFLANDRRIPKNALQQGTTSQAEFIWLPGYHFVEEAEKVKTVRLTFFALDKSGNRVERKANVNVFDTENLDEKDKVLFQKYKNTLQSAKVLLDRLDENHEKISKALKKAKKGKKHRAIINASLGATTGLSPVILSSNPDSYRAVSAIGGTTVLTLGTLEATEVIGRSRNELLDKLKINVEIRNQLLLEGDNFARKYALKSTRREKSFDADRDKFLPIINNQKLELLELTAAQTANVKYENKEIKKTFADFSEE